MDAENKTVNKNCLLPQCKRFEGNFQILNKPDIFALCETNLHDGIHDSHFQCLATCKFIARMLGICMALVFMLRAIFQLLARLFLRMKTSLMCFPLALLHSSSFIFFLHLLPSSSSCTVVEAVSSNIDKALILQPSANIMVCGTSMPVIPSCLLWH